MHAARSKTKNSFKICFTQYELPKEETFFFIHSFVHSFILFGGLGAFYCCSTNKSQIFSHLYLCIKLRMRVIGLFFLKQKICIKCMRRMLLIMCSSYQRTISPLCEYVYARAAKSSKFVMMMIIIGCCRWFAHFVVFTFVSGMRCYCLFTYEKKTDTFAPYNKINSLFENRNHFIE